MDARRVILDVDTGIDDMVALLIAATAPELNLRGVTCVAGNVEIHHVARNTGKILQLVGRGDVPVSIGAARPLTRRLRTAPETHGPTGTGYVELTGEEPPLATTDFTASLPRSTWRARRPAPRRGDGRGAGAAHQPGGRGAERGRPGQRTARADLDGRHARGARQHDRDRRVERLRRSRGGGVVPGAPAPSAHLPAGRHPGRHLHHGRPRRACPTPTWPASCATRCASTSASTGRPMGSTAATCTIR